MAERANYFINSKSLDPSVLSPRVVTTGKHIANSIRNFNERRMEVYRSGLIDTALSVFEDGTFDSAAPSALEPPFVSIDLNKYRTTMMGPAIDVGTYRVISRNKVESDQHIGQAEMDLTDARVTSVSQIESESSHLMKKGRKLGDIILGARQYYESSKGIKVIVCEMVLDDIEMNILQRTGIWGDFTVNGSPVNEA